MEARFRCSMASKLRLLGATHVDEFVITSVTGPLLSSITIE